MYCSSKHWENALVLLKILHNKLSKHDYNKHQYHISLRDILLVMYYCITKHGMLVWYLQLKPITMNYKRVHDSPMALY